MSAPELKPCPFCGGEAEVEQKGSNRRSHIIRCQDCNCSLETGETWNAGAQWNTRSDTVESAIRKAVEDGVQVKPLVWGERHSVCGTEWFVETPFGEYTVFFDVGWHAQLEDGIKWEWEPDLDSRSYGGPEEPQSAAETHYSNAALAMIEPTPRDAIKQAVEAAI